MSQSFRFFLLILMVVLSWSVSAQEFGKASYYSNEFDGGKTHFGETYDKDAYTAAHKVHPQGTRLKVTRLGNNKSVVVRVNDRGPYISGRIIELSYAAAAKLDMIGREEVDVKIEVISKGTGTAPVEEPEKEEAKAQQPNRSTANTQARGDARNTESANQESPERVTTAYLNQPPSATPSRDRNKETPAIENRPADQRLTRGYQPYGLFEIKIYDVRKTGFGVQVGSFTSYENTIKMIAELQGRWFNDIVVSVQKEGGNTRYKLILGPFETREKASNYLTSLRNNKKGIDGFVVDLSRL